MSYTLCIVLCGWMYRELKHHHRECRLNQRAQTRFEDGKEMGKRLAEQVIDANRLEAHAHGWRDCETYQESVRQMHNRMSGYRDAGMN